MIRIVAWCLLFLCMVSSHAQQLESQTGNIVYTTLNPPPPGAPYNWTGFVTTQSGGGGETGGNIPGYNTATGTFLFGYNLGTVSYTTAVNFALLAAGTGIQVSGFKYSWNYFNQDFSRGTLTGNISLTSSSGKTLESYNYAMTGTKEGWTAMSGIQNFSTSYAPTSLGNLNLTLTGKDDRYWAGYYGPQIKDIDIKLLYTASSQSSNTSCTAFSVDPTCVSQRSLSNNAVSTPFGTFPVTDIDVVPAPVSVASTATVTTVSTVSVQNTSTTGSTLSSRESSAPANGTGMALNLVAKNQQRENSVIASVVKDSLRDLEQSTQQVQQDAVAAAVSPNLLDSYIGSGNKSFTQADVAAGPVQTVQGLGQPSGQTLALLAQPNQPQGLMQMSSTNTGSGSSIAAMPVPSDKQVPISIEVITNDAQQMLMDRSSALFQTLDSKPMDNQSYRPLGQAVKQDNIVQNNELAKGSDILQLTKTPSGYNEYLNLYMKDAAFYLPRVIYSNQRTVDNTRALRQLGSDRLHQQIIEQQYRRQ